MRGTVDTTDVIYLLKLITDRATVLFSEHVEIPLTSAQTRVLMYLERCSGGPVSQKELEQYLHVSHTTAKGLLQRLEEKGYVRTAFDSEDGRVKNAYLTEKSRQQRELLSGSVKALQEQMLSGLSEEERSELRRLLLAVFSNID